MKHDQHTFQCLSSLFFMQKFSHEAISLFFNYRESGLNLRVNDVNDNL